MCGILGVITKKNSKIKPSLIKAITNSLFNLSESRGKEATGLVVKTEKETIVLKEPIAPHKMIKSKKYKEILNKQTKIKPLTIIGHSRLVTDGDQALNKNNQPVIKYNIIGVHNGIITNYKQLFEKFKIKREYEIDTEIIPSLIHLFLKKQKLNEAVEKVFQLIEGSASIAFLIKNKLVLATNTGSIYVHKTNQMMIFASEEYILRKIKKDQQNISQIKPGEICVFDLNFKKETRIIDLSAKDTPIKKADQKFDKSLLKYNPDLNLKRCTKCILPETFPGIKFDEKEVCNICNNYQKIETLGKEKLEERVKNFRKSKNQIDCLVALSGGRDSSYTLHYIKKELKMNPVAFSYDWGMITDLGRRNQARLCGKLGIEHIWISANIKEKRENIKKNILAWLKKPNLGTVPLFMAGDKQYFYYAQKLKKQLGVGLLILGENPFEKTNFKTGFSNIKPESEKGLSYALSTSNKIKIATYYLKEFIKNPDYFNSSLLDTLWGYVCYYLIPHRYINLYKYIDWKEDEINQELIKNYNWETAKDTENTWRIGDGTAAFYNYIYYALAGFTENDTFRSNQIREELISREEALNLIRKENKPRYPSIKWYCDIVNIDFNKTIKIINSAPRIYKI